MDTTTRDAMWAELEQVQRESFAQRHRDLQAAIDAGNTLRMRSSLAKGNIKFAIGSVQVGFACVWIADRVVTLDELVIHSDQRGRGYGKEALRLLIEAARAAGLYEIKGDLDPADREHAADVTRFFKEAGFAVELDRERLLRVIRLAL
jgi:GNAT superfamily N-acetyltransferase